MPDSNLLCLVINESHVLRSLGSQMASASTQNGLTATDARMMLNSGNGDDFLISFLPAI
jgi:hypothetical protein